jgi:hypothetical protein
MSWREWERAAVEAAEESEFAPELPSVAPLMTEDEWQRTWDGEPNASEPPPPKPTEPTQAPHEGKDLIATPFTAIGMRSIEWHEKPLWQRSAFQLLAGPKGAGKGTYLAGLAARVSLAGGNVLFRPGSEPHRGSQHEQRRRSPRRDSGPQSAS